MTRRAGPAMAVALAAGVLLPATTLADAAPPPLPPSPTGTARCAAIRSLNLPDTVIASATVVAPTAATATAPALPAVCRVVAHVRANPGSDIGVEIWLPLTGWSGVFHGNGNGGFAGVLAAGYPGMAAGVRRGYASAVTDTGTAPATPLAGDALIGRPAQWRDWGRRSTHAMTVTGKAIAAAFYGRASTRAYYTGCSTGGQQGLVEALHYPDDYDGILVGAPVINRTWGHAAVLADFAAANRTPGAILTDAKLQRLNRAAIATCRRQGRAVPGDPFVSDALGCRFDPGVLRCRPGRSADCLTPREIVTARTFYRGPPARDGRPGFFGWLPGSEAPGRFGWSFLQSASAGGPQFGSLFKWVFGADWNWRSFDFARDMARVDAALGDSVNDATRGSLRRFAARGGRLIVYHGLADTLVPPGQSVAFFQRQARQLGGTAQLSRSARLYLAPGMAHCAGGAGPDSFNSAIAGAAPPAGSGAARDLFLALTDWVEHGAGAAPNVLLATKFDDDAHARVAFERPLCPFPRRQRYRGGSRLDPASFRCDPAAR